MTMTEAENTALPLLSIHNLVTRFRMGDRQVDAVNHVSINIHAGETLAELGAHALPEGAPRQLRPGGYVL